MNLLVEVGKHYLVELSAEKAQVMVCVGSTFLEDEEVPLFQLVSGEEKLLSAYGNCIRKNNDEADFYQEPWRKKIQQMSMDMFVRDYGTLIGEKDDGLYALFEHVVAVLLDGETPCIIHSVRVSGGVDSYNPKFTMELTETVGRRRRKVHSRGNDVVTFVEMIPV